jgi:hypothetical protein
MARIVTTTYRYKPPPKRKGRKLAEITGPAVITSVDPKKSSRRAVLAETAAKEELSTRSPAGDTEPSTPPGKASTPANDDGPRAASRTDRSGRWTCRCPASRSSARATTTRGCGTRWRGGCAANERRPPRPADAALDAARQQRPRVGLIKACRHPGEAPLQQLGRWPRRRAADPRPSDPIFRL